MHTLKSAKLFFLSLLFFCTVSGQKKHEWRDGSSEGIAYRYVTNDPMKVRLYTLKNGLTVLLSPNKKEPRIKALIGVRAGSNSDPKEHTGLAHYLEHLLFKGTFAYGSLDSAKERPYLDQVIQLYDVYNHTTDTTARKNIYHQIDSVSGIAAKYAIPNEYTKMLTGMGSEGTNAHTFVEETVYEEDIPSNAVDKYLAVQAERFRDPVFRLFHTELEAVYEEKNRGLDSDPRKVWEAMLDGLFPVHNYGQQSTLGTIAHLKNPSLIAIRDFYNKYYVPGNMGIVMAGDFNSDELIKKINRAFSYMPVKPVVTYEGINEQPLSAPVVKEVTGPDAENISIAFRLPGSMNHHAEVILTVIGQLLVNGKAGLMDLNLNKQQKVLSAGADVHNWRDYSLLVLAGKAKEGQSLEEVKDILLSQLDLLRKGSFDSSLIRSIISNFKLGELQGMESNDSRATTLMNSFIMHKGAQWKTDVSYIDDMAKVTRDQVMGFVNEYLNNNYVVVYKKKGDNKIPEKVQKPPITPITINSDVQSDFNRNVSKIPENILRPEWLDYNKDMSRTMAGTSPFFYVQNKDNDLFRLYYRFDMGNWNDKQLALAAGYLQYLGDDQHTTEQISRMFYDIACSFSISPGNENTMITISGLQENFDKAVKLFEHFILNCKPDEEALKNLKARILKSRVDGKASKANIAKGLVSYAVYGEKNPFNYQISADELKLVTASDLVTVLHGLFNYKHTIIYYGPAALNKLVTGIKAVHQIPATPKKVPPAVKFDKKDMTGNKVLFTPYDMVQSEITWVNNSIGYDRSKTAIIQLFNSYFGGDMGSVVFQTIRESKALAYATYSGISSPDKKEGRYTVLAYIGSQADKMNDAVAAMNELLDSLPLRQETLANGKESIRKSIASERITKDGIVFSYLAALRLGITTDERKQVYEEVDALGMGEIQKFYETEIAKKPYTYCVIASASKIKMDDLKKLGDLQELTLEQIFGY